MTGHDVLVRPQAWSKADTEWVLRFGLTERFAHWWTVSMVATALLSGLAMGDDGGSGPLVTVHWGSVVLIGVGFVRALVLGTTRALLRATWNLFSFDRRDAAWIRDHVRDPLGEDAHGAYGMFNPDQKALAWAMTVAVGAVIPATNHALHGMTLGRVRRSWATHHGGWLEDQERRNRGAARPGTPRR